MKRIVCVSVFALFALSVILAVPTGLADDWGTGRETVEASSGWTNISFTSAGAGGALFMADNVSLPSDSQHWDQTLTFFGIEADGGDIWVNLTVNGVAILDTVFVEDGNFSNKTLADLSLAANTSYIDYNLTVSNSTNYNYAIDFIGNEMPLNDGFLNGIDYFEMDISDEIKVGKSWRVNDSINVTNGDVFDLDEVLLNLTYPSHARTNNDTVDTINTSSLAASADWNTVVSYRKNGPTFEDEDDNDEYIIDVQEDGDVEVTIDSPEDLDDVKWYLDPTEFVEFDGLDADVTDLVITFDGNELNEDDDDDWEWNDGILEISNLDMEEGDEDNIAIFSWTGAGSGGTGGDGDGDGDGDVLPPDDGEETPLWEQEYLGVPMLLLVGIIAVIVLVIIVASRKN